MTSDDDDVPDNRRLRRMSIAAGVLAVPLVVLYWPGCRQYPAVTSPESLSLMKLLYAACNTQDPARLAKVEQGVEKASRAGQISAAEQEAFAKITALAKRGDWKQAEAEAFRFAQDQIGAGGTSKVRANVSKSK